jgi:hypothetical protein
MDMRVRLASQTALGACLIVLCTVLVAGLLVSVSAASGKLPRVGDQPGEREQQNIRVYGPATVEPSYWVYLPLVTRRFVPGIHGQVTYRGEAAAGIALHLRLCDEGSSCSEPFTATTGADGAYAFVGAPSLGAGQKYNVRFGPNTAPAGDPRYLSNWYGPDILSYTAGDSVDGGDFDIANVDLSLPCSGAKVLLPIGFSWQPRQLVTDTYRLLLSSPVTWDVVWESADLGTLGGFGFDSLPPGLVQDQAYDWQVNVYSASNGFGSSFARPQITFLPAVQSGIYGRVTYNCATAGGIELKLYFHNGAAWSTISTTTTNVDGNYVFPPPPGLAGGQMYRVGFGPNQDSTGGNPSYVYRWYGPDITSYTAGTAAPGGSNDIANVQLLSPPAGATVPLPALFEWQRRSLGPESYQWVLYNPSPPYTIWRTANLGDVSSYPLEALPSGFGFGSAYRWYVNVYSSADGYVTSYYVRAIAFSAGAASQVSGSLAPGGAEVYEDLTGSVPSWEQ